MKFGKVKQCDQAIHLLSRLEGPVQKWVAKVVCCQQIVDQNGGKLVDRFIEKFVYLRFA